MSRLFISVERLDNWKAEGRASLVGDRMTLTELGRAFLMKPGVVFVKVTGADKDPNELVGLVKSKEWLEANGGEQFESSVILNETAYDVIDGFIGEPLPP